MLIGLYRNTDPFKSMPNERIQALAEEALKQNVNLIFFNSSNVNFTQEIITGQYYNGEKWITHRVPYPTVMINELPLLSKKRTDEENKLRKKIHCTTYLIGGKADIYNKLEKHDIYKSLVIPTQKIKNVETILKQLEIYNKIVIKPITGRQGKNIFFITKEKSHYIVKEHTTEKKYQLQPFINYLQSLIESKTYIGQPYIECTTREGAPYDFRIHVQRQRDGNWGVTKVYPRIGAKESILSNISRGGFTQDINLFLEEQFGNQADITLQVLQNTALGVAEHINSHYHFAIDELGIDLAIDVEGNVWLYEVNTGPQTRFHEKERAVHTIAYAKYLTEKHRKSVFNNDLPSVALLTGIAGTTLLKQACNYAAIAENANFFYFTPNSLNQFENSIYGYVYLNGRSVYKELPQPDVIYDRLRARGSKRYSEMYAKLDSWHIPFSNKRRGGSLSKGLMYKKLKNFQPINQYVIPYERITEVEQAISFIHQEKDVIVKGKWGSHGLFINRIRQISEEHYELILNSRKEIINYRALQDKINNEWKGKYIIQKYVQSTTQNGRPYDIRIHLVRGNDSKFHIAERYARIGSADGLVSNLGMGGYIRKLKDFYVDEYTIEEREIIQKNLDAVTDKIINLIEYEYGLAVPEIGLDIGIESPNDLWIFEYNINNPGTTMHEYEVASLMIPYLLTKTKPL